MLIYTTKNVIWCSFPIIKLLSMESFKSRSRIVLYLLTIAS